MIQSLQAPDSTFIQAAMGWYELDAVDEAQVELDKIKPKFRNHPSVLEIRWLLCAKLNRWSEALEIADTMMDLIQTWPKTNPCAGIDCLTEAAWTVRQMAARLYSDQPRVYDLACMCCVLGKLDQAKMLLDNAIAVGGDSIRQRAIQDRYLEPLWPDLQKR